MSLVRCRDVAVRLTASGYSAYAARAFSKGDLIERGAMLPVQADGRHEPFLFAWDDSVPTSSWAIASGCAAFYNCSYNPNCRFERNFDRYTFEIRALHDIAAHDELTFTYKSLTWRPAFAGLDISRLLVGPEARL